MRGFGTHLTGPERTFCLPSMKWIMVLQISLSCSVGSADPNPGDQYYPGKNLLAISPIPDYHDPFNIVRANVCMDFFKTNSSMGSQ